METDRELIQPLTRRWMREDGLRLCGDCWGNPQAPLVLLLHGGGQTRHAWKRTGELLARRGFHAVALDARGHGDSDWAAGGAYSPDDMAEDIIAVAAEIAAPQTALVGASMGGGAALVAAARAPSRCDALVLVDIVPRMEVAGIHAIWAFLDRNTDGFDTLEEVHEAVASYQPHRKRKRNLEGLKKNLRIGGDGRYYWHWDPDWRTANRNISAYMDRLDQAARALSAPVLLVRGKHSNVLSQRGVDAFLDTCPQAEFVDVQDAAHMIAGDQNDAFSDAVIAFLERKMLPTGSSGGQDQR